MKVLAQWMIVALMGAQAAACADGDATTPNTGDDAASAMDVGGAEDAGPSGDAEVTTDDDVAGPGEDVPSSEDEDGTGRTPWPDPTYGLSTQTLMHDDLSRSYLQYVPTSYTAEVSMPVVLNFHGGGMDAEAQLNWTSDMRDLADSEGFILVYPEGSALDTGEGHWNPIPPSADSKSDTDDFGFVAAMLDKMAEDLNIDADRVYATGYSNGAGMAYGLLCYLSDRIAAAAPVSGSMYFQMAEECTATHPTAIAIFNGTEDSERPYEGIPVWFMGVDEAVDFWVAHNGLPDTPVTESFDTSGVTVERRVYEGDAAAASVARFKVIGGGHVWFDITLDGADLNGIIWDFFSRHDIHGAR